MSKIEIRKAEYSDCMKLSKLKKDFQKQGRGDNYANNGI